MTRSNDLSRQVSNASTEPDRTFKFPKPSDFLPIEKYTKNNNYINNNDDTDLDQDISTSSSVMRHTPKITPPPPSPPPTQRHQPWNGSIRQFNGYSTDRYGSKQRNNYSQK